MTYVQDKCELGKFTTRRISRIANARGRVTASVEKNSADRFKAQHRPGGPTTRKYKVI